MTFNPLLCGIKDTALMLGISHKTASNQISLKTFPLPVVRLGGRTLFRLSDIHQFVATGKPVQSAPAARDPNTVDLISGTTDAEAKPRRGRPRKIATPTGRGA